MPSALRNTLALLVGMAAGFTVVFVIESIGHQVYPPPADLDFSDPAAIREFVRTLPLGAFLFVLAAWVAGAFGGAWVAAAMANTRRMTFAGIVGALVLAASVANLLMIPHPLWFSVAALIAVPAAAVAGGRLATSAAARRVTA